MERALASEFGRRVVEAMGRGIGRLVATNGWIGPWRSHVLRIQTSTLCASRTSRQAPPADPGLRIGPTHQACGTCSVRTAEQIRITEIHAKGDPHYMENASDAACSLSGWRITDDLNEVGWELSAGCLSGRGGLGYEKGRGGFPFGCPSREVLFLLDSAGDVKRQIQVLPTVENQAQGSGNSGNWSLVEPSPGKVNRTINRLPNFCPQDSLGCKHPFAIFAPPILGRI